MNTPVSFELAKLLKEKGFDGNYFHYWNMVNHSGKWKVDTSIWEHTNNYIEAPTIAEVVMWLYEKHGIWIEASLNQFSKPKDLHWMYSITFTQNCTYSHSPKSYKSPTEAYEAGIEDVLINMI